MVVVVAALVVLALVTQAGVVVLQRAYPAQGKTIDVAGATLHVVDIGPRDSAVPPIVMIHGASSNLETMRQPLGDRLAKTHRVILIDRPGHGWSVRAREQDSTPAIQARMIDDALEAIGHRSGGLCGPLVGRRARRAHGAGLSAAGGGPRHAGAGGLSVARRCRMVQQGRHHARDRPAARLYDHAATRVLAGRARRPRRIPAADHAKDYVRKTATLLLLRPREFLANARDLVTLKAAVAEQAPRYGDIRTPTVVTQAIPTTRFRRTSIHGRSRPRCPDAKLIVLPGVGHMVQNAAPEPVEHEIDAMIGRNHTAAVN